MKSCVLALLWLLSAMPVMAAAGTSPIGPSGGLLSSAPLGADDFMSGVAPPPGVYWLNYSFHYRADKFTGGDGNEIQVGPLDDFKARITGNVFRYFWMPERDIRILGGRWAPDFGFALLDKRLKVGGRWFTEKGVGDLIFAPVNLFYRWGDVHAVLYVDFIAPTGKYDKHKVANLGNNHWTIKPAALFSLVKPRWEITGIFNIDFNTTNNDYIDPRTGLESKHRSGKAFHMDYAASWRATPKLNIGIQGYYWNDLEDDRVDGKRVNNTQTRVFAIGPGVRYQLGSLAVVAKAQREFGARNRPEGSVYWLRLMFPL
ncbi:MAG: hypothetical protein DRQ54_09490 [Gammaproteobacteria bacterium]|nr:MAG: hypothetical protein DRQ54_09490 [Gammaproteobacteria bacterium]RLA13167.1 MAG: hypothetical protein DRQ52_06730 [Gammaproteobacteria bacterium]